MIDMQVIVSIDNFKNKLSRCASFSEGYPRLESHFYYLHHRIIGQPLLPFIILPDYLQNIDLANNFSEKIKQAICEAASKKWSLKDAPQKQHKNNYGKNQPDQIEDWCHFFV